MTRSVHPTFDPTTQTWFTVEPGLEAEAPKLAQLQEMLGADVVIVGFVRDGGRIEIPRPAPEPPKRPYVVEPSPRWSGRSPATPKPVPPAKASAAPKRPSQVKPAAESKHSAQVNGIVNAETPIPSPAVPSPAVMAPGSSLPAEPPLPGSDLAPAPSTPEGVAVGQAEAVARVPDQPAPEARPRRERAPRAVVKPSDADPLKLTVQERKALDALLAHPEVTEREMRAAIGGRGGREVAKVVISRVRKKAGVAVLWSGTSWSIPDEYKAKLEGRVAA